MRIIKKWSRRIRVPEYAGRDGNVPAGRKHVGAACLALLALVVSAGCSHRTEGRWQPDGLRGVFIHSLASTSAFKGTQVAGTEQGIYIRRPAGGWRRALANREVWSVCIRGREILGADNSGSIDVSHDLGRHWHVHLLTPAGAYAVTAKTSDPRWILVGAGRGIYLSRDGGTRWRRTLALGNNAVDGFAWAPLHPGVVLAATVPGGGRGSIAPPVVISHNSGRTWSPLGRGLPRSGVMSLVALGHGRVLAGTMGHAVWQLGSRG